MLNNKRRHTNEYLSVLQLYFSHCSLFFLFLFCPINKVDFVYHSSTKFNVNCLNDLYWFNGRQIVPFIMNSLRALFAMAKNSLHTVYISSGQAPIMPSN